MSSLAQEESRSISENVTWGKRKSFADGKVNVPYSTFLGYDKGENGTLAVNQEQAKVVRMIFRLFLEGLTPYSIAKRLTEEHIPTPSGKKIWNQSTISYVLTNEKYKGDALLQKNYTVDFLSKKRKKNAGEIPQYYVESNHERIIEPQVFEAVQQELERRAEQKTRYSGVGLFSSKIKCGECGNWYGSKVWHSNSKYRRTIYQCNQKFKEKCNTPHLYEEEIKQSFILAVNKLITDKNEIIKNLELVRETLSYTEALREEERELLSELDVLVGMVQNCIAENARAVLDQAKYQERYNGLVEKYEEKKSRLEKVQTQIADKTARAETLKNFIAALKKQDSLITEFDDMLWSSLMDYATVYSKEDIRFLFRDGTEIKA